MSESQKKILEMLSDKKINVEEAYRLLSALKTEGGTLEGTAGAGPTDKPKAKYLRVCVVPRQGHKHGGHKHEGQEHEGDEDDDNVEIVNVRVPMALIRSGMKFTSVLPQQARDKVAAALNEKGIDFDMRNMKPEEVEEMIEALSDLKVDVVSDKEVVKVFVE